MAVIQLGNYEDFQLLVGVGSQRAVYYWADNNPYWYAYAHLGNDWFWLAVSAGLDDNGEPKSFKQDFPQATELRAGLEFK